MASILENLEDHLSRAVAHYWLTRKRQATRQRVSGTSDRGARSAVTGGAQMDEFIALITDLVLKAGIGEDNIFQRSRLELPGFYRPTKEWDLLAVRDGELILALEVKSQVGPSFGNNFNNRTEEAIGSAVDLWTAYREGAFNGNIRPWLGYVFLLEDCDESRAPVRVKEPHFEVFPEFKKASYSKRYEFFCRKLVRERNYNAAAFLMSERKAGLKGAFLEPADDLTFQIFARSLVAHAAAFADAT